MSKIALTFDDGPVPGTTPTILKTLRAAGIHATFMLWGEHVQQHPDILKQAYHDGHAFGSHTFSHRSLTELEDQQIKQELARTDQAVMQVIGDKPQFFRPPYGSVDARVSHAAGRPAVTWSLDSEDWKSHDAALILARIVRLAQDGDIVLMHDIQPATATALPQVIDFLQANDFHFVTIPEMFAGMMEPDCLYRSQNSIEKFE